MKIFPLLLLVLLSADAYSQKNNGQELIDHFFDLYEKEGPDKALTYAFGTNAWMDANSDAVKNVIFELDKTINLVGNYIGNEQIQSASAGSRFRILSYFVYYDRQPIRFTFELYKNNEGWMLWNFKFDTDYDSEIEESIKLGGTGENTD